MTPSTPPEVAKFLWTQANISENAVKGTDSQELIAVDWHRSAQFSLRQKVVAAPSADELEALLPEEADHLLAAGPRQSSHAPVVGGPSPGVGLL